MEAAHQLKGLAATMTINELASISLKIETSARSEQWNQLPELRRILGDEFEQVAAYIASVLKATP
jgi:HPt (histidine-containing phosphotransfer) domain-containing protein